MLKFLIPALALISALQAAETKTNIVLFFVDDMGWSDLGYRNPAFESPNIDQLAAESLDFQQAYIPTPTCSPSRATLLTGKHPARLEFFRHIPGPPSKKSPDEPAPGKPGYHLWKTDPAQVPSRNFLPLSHTTYAEALGTLGYHNVLVGKWHLGHEKHHPVKQGFHQQIGTSNSGHPKSYYPPYFKNSIVYTNEKERYLTDKLTDGAVELIESYDRKKPLMLSFWYYSVHGPHVGQKDHLAHFQKKGLTGKLAHYAAMVKSVDDSVGRVRAALKAKGIAKNTLIIFLSDQGGAFSNAPFQGGKKSDTLYEGGARVPLLVNWPGVTKPGTKNNSIVQSTDLFPTLIELAGGDPSTHQNLDGISLLETIKTNTLLERQKPIYGYRAYEDLYASVREGDFKLLAYRSGQTKLYNIPADPGETTDLSQKHPKKVADFKTKLQAWEKSMNVQKYSGIK